MRVHHIGYLVNNIKSACLNFTKLGFLQEGDIVFDEQRGIDILFMRNSDCRIELVSPKTEKSIVSKTIKTLGNCPYHICYECSDIQKTVSKMRKEKYIPMGEPSAAPALGNSPIVFMFNKDIGIVEFVERK